MSDGIIPGYCAVNKNRDNAQEINVKIENRRRYNSPPHHSMCASWGKTRFVPPRKLDAFVKQIWVSSRINNYTLLTLVLVIHNLVGENLGPCTSGLTVLVYCCPAIRGTALGRGYEITRMTSSLRLATGLWQQMGTKSAGTKEVVIKEPFRKVEHLSLTKKSYVTMYITTVTFLLFPLDI